MAYPVPKFLAACFDLDGTLIDTTPLHLAAETGALREMGADPADPRRPWTFGLGDVGGMQLLADALSLDARRLQSAYYPRWVEQVAAGAELKPGALDLLEAISTIGVPMTLVTSGDRAYVRSMFDSCGLANFFDATVTMDDVENLKPHAEPYLMAANLIGVEPARCIGFEDSPAGLAALRAAGMFSVAVVNGEAPGDADLVVGGLDSIDGKMLREWFGAPRN